MWAGIGDVMVLSSHGQQHIDVISREHRRPKWKAFPSANSNAYAGYSSIWIFVDAKTDATPLDAREGRQARAVFFLFLSLEPC
jgi:hypothetical protein